MNNMYLICNAHLDPVWLWEWEEGAAEAISTFRVAADLCERFDGFIFNHNEVTLYKWVEEYEPELFARIQKLVSEGKWHIMGGWYLQPDLNMPTAESIIRQMLTGREYFKTKFGVVPTTAINFDPFGHPRGLVQLIKKGGYDSYVFCRPAASESKIPGEDFVWVGFDGSEIMAHHSPGYNSPLGRGAEMVSRWLKGHADQKDILFLWGVGNHGGGASKVDLERIAELIANTKTTKIKHSTPEEYFARIKKSYKSLPRREKDLQPFSVGCYTSQIRVKQKHRLLENELYTTEKMLSHAALAGLLNYPKAEVGEAVNDLMQSEFHDILPGSSIAPVEETSLRLMDHALEKLSRIKARAFFALCSGQPVAAEGEIPIIAYNPHPYPVEGIFECEFQLADQNWKDTYTLPRVFQNGKRVPSQCEKEASNLPLDWRKRIVFSAKLAPGSINRFDCRMEILLSKPAPDIAKVGDNYVFRNSDGLEVVISTLTGLVEGYRINGRDFVKPGAFKPIVLDDTDDAWSMNTKLFRNIIGEFKLTSPEEGSLYSGLKNVVIDSVRVAEDGDVRTTIEAIMRFNNSFIVQSYKLPKRGTQVQVDLRVYWNEKVRMLKLSIPTTLSGPRYIGQVCGGVEDFTPVADQYECVSQKWAAVVSDSDDLAFAALNNCSYGLDFTEGEMRLTLLRSPAYSGHPISNRDIVPQNRFTARIDQGERQFSYWFDAGEKAQVLGSVDHNALAKNEKPFVLSFFPSGHGSKPEQLVKLGRGSVQVMAVKQAQIGENFIIRLYNPTAGPCSATVEIPVAGIKQSVRFKTYEIKTFELDIAQKALKEVPMLESDFSD